MIKEKLSTFRNKFAGLLKRKSARAVSNNAGTNNEQRSYEKSISRSSDSKFDASTPDLNTNLNSALNKASDAHPDRSTQDRSTRSESNRTGTIHSPPIHTAVFAPTPQPRLTKYSSSDSQVIALIKKGIAWFHALSQREQSIVVTGVVVLVAIGLNQAYTPISDAFGRQDDRLAELQRYASAAPAVIERYSRLGARKEQLEKRFKEIEFKEGALSYIENLVRQQPGVAPGFDIREGTTKEFGKSFEQQPFIVRFQTTNAAGFVEFLRSVARGERSLLISKLEIQKPRRGDRLEVDLELNTIRQKS